MQSTVKLPLVFTIMVSAVAVFTSSKMGRFPTVESFCPSRYTSLSSISTRSTVDSRLFAKPKNEKEKKKNVANSNRNFETSEATTLPANLKRKVEAKRPPLGHVVPEATRTKGCELFITMSFS